MLEPAGLSPIPWAIQVDGTSREDPGLLVRRLTGAVLGCGGWVLSRGETDAGIITILFEFERRFSVEIYTILIALGVELSAMGHRRLTELCQCTCLREREAGGSVASVDLEIQTLSGAGEVDSSKLGFD